jgi:hypothetical protein
MAQPPPGGPQPRVLRCVRGQPGAGDAHEPSVGSSRCPSTAWAAAAWIQVAHVSAQGTPLPPHGTSTAICDSCAASSQPAYPWVMTNVGQAAARQHI